MPESRASDPPAMATESGLRQGATSVVLVTFNSGPLLWRCLASLARLRPQPAVVVVDNGSDQSWRESLNAELLRLRDAAPADSLWQRGGLVLLDNPGNPGFAHACNRGLAEVNSEYVLFLNPDCELSGTAIEKMQAALAATPAASLAGAWVVNADGSPQRGSRRRLPDLARAFREAWMPRSRRAGEAIDLSGLPQPDQTVVVEGISGACMLGRTGRLRQLGGFDSGYRLHCEDLDLMARLAHSGDSVLLVPDAKVIHHGGASSSARPFWVAFHKHRGMARYHRKFTAAQHGWLTNLVVHAGIWLHFLAVLPGLCWRRLRGSRQTPESQR